MKFEIGPYITIITAIAAAFLTYKNQLRLKAFELFLARRDSVLKDTEKFVEKLYTVQDTINAGMDKATWDKFKGDLFHESLILCNKARGANFGKQANLFLDTFESVIREPLEKKELNKKEWVCRSLNCITIFYGTAHKQITKEIENMSFSLWGKLKRLCSNMFGGPVKFSV